MNTRAYKILALLMSLCLVGAAFAPSAAMAKKKKKTKVACAQFTPVEPASNSGQTAEALEAPIVPITDEYTEAAPFTVEYAHGPALWETASQMPIQEDTVFFNFQIVSAQPAAGLYIRQEWASPSTSDMDLYVYDLTGAQAVNSGSANAPEPIGGPGGLGEPAGQGTGASGYESISGFPSANCTGYTVESRAFQTLGEDMTLKVWLGPPA
ncbi:MAG TPA: hypothetical protein VNC78_07505 [Actinomycetota bacterium]|nr:hypothetical protein [Actinomycetota bacterium]